MANDYEIAVIGGGSGGMAAAKEAAKLGVKTVMFDYVTPTTHGTKWGPGGTCVNVGCIPKKLMHYAGAMGPILHHDAAAMGWKLNMDAADQFDWQKCVQTVQMTVKRLSFGYRGGLRSAGVEYINALASLDPTDPSRVKYKTANGEDKTVTADKIIIAVGGRPQIPSEVVNAAELAITSDDIFSRPTPPGKTLVIGGSYIALECAGFLAEMGFDTTVIIRSVPLRLFDQQCATKVAEMMEEFGTKFKRKVLVERLDKTSSGRILATFNDPQHPPEEFDTVLVASGRNPATAGLNLEAAGVKLSTSGKVIVSATDQTSLAHVYAIGDCAEGRMELTPVAIKTAEHLVRRLVGGSKAMDHSMIPTTIFTPIEYGTVGLSEEAAVAQYGEDDVEVFLQEHKTLEIEGVHRPKVAAKRAHQFDMELSLPCLVKLVCVKSENMRVVGFHFVGPNAGEVTQGFALAMRLGAKKDDFDDVVGIHPTDAEAFANLSITKRSGKPYAMGGCGGGKCG